MHTTWHLRLNESAGRVGGGGASSHVNVGRLTVCTVQSSSKALYPSGQGPVTRYTLNKVSILLYRQRHEPRHDATRWAPHRVRGGVARGSATGARDVPTHPSPHHQPPAHQEHEPERVSLPFLLSPLHTHTHTHRLHSVLCSAPLVQSLSSSHRPSTLKPSLVHVHTPFAAVASASPLHLLPARLTVGAPVAQARLARAQPTRTRTPYSLNVSQSHSRPRVMTHADAPTVRRSAS